MTDQFAAELGVRGANCCFTHFLDVTSRYYAAALPTCHDILTRARRLREDNAPKSATPRRRIQPPRGVRRKASPPAECRVKPSVKRKIKNLLARMPIPMGESGRLMSEETWQAEVKAVAEKEITRKVVERYKAGLTPCAFGARMWTCTMCEKEVQQRLTGLWWGAWSWPVMVAGLAWMEGPVEVSGLGAGDWRGVEIPEAEVVRVGGLRFVVDVCGHSLVMFV